VELQDSRKKAISMGSLVDWIRLLLIEIIISKRCH